MAEQPVGRRPKRDVRNKKIRPLHGGGAACVGEVLRGGGETVVYKDGGAGFVLAAGCCAGVEPSTVLVIRRTSTRRFFARPSLVLLSSTGLSLPSPTR